MRTWPFLEAPLHVTWPTGIHLALFLAFLALGAASLVYAFAWKAQARPALLLHVAGGLLTLLAGDLITLLIGWELLSFSAFFLIASGGGTRAPRAAWRYLVFQIVAAAALFAGAAVQADASGSLAVTVADPAAQPLLLLAIAIKTAVIPLHGWLVDGYPAAPPALAPLLSVFATKVGVYTAARLLNLPPVSLLGGLMAVGGVLGALGQRTGRRLLSYHIVSQVGFMLAGVGLATGAGIAAGTFHAINNLAYKALLFMVIGAVIRQTGHDRLDGLGGLARQMPFTFAAGVIASASIAGLPPFNGFASKELLKSALGEGPVAWLLVAATVGTGLSFIKFIALVFLGRGRAEGIAPPRDPPPGMAVPMALLAAACLVLGLWPSLAVRGVAHAYYRPAAIGYAVFPLLGSAALWLAFRVRLAHLRLPAPWPAVRRIARQAARRTRARARAVHEMGWQATLAVALAAWLALALLFVGGDEDAPHGDGVHRLDEPLAQGPVLEHPRDLGQEPDVRARPRLRRE